MMNPFAWIASRVRAAVVLGFSQGLDDIGAMTDQPIDPTQALNQLQTRLAIAAPKEVAEDDAEPTNKSNKKRGS